MAQAWKTVRVFIESTFRDMQAERDHLVRFVFPRLREELLKRRIQFVEVDLRWGVTSEQDAMEVVRELVDECRPRFLCMLGGRYGWVPPGKTRSITADVVHYGVLDRALKDRGFAYFYFRDDAATAAMVETRPGEFSEPQGSENQNKLAELKQAIIAAGLNTFTYPAQWDNDSRRLAGLKKVGDQVYDDLLESIRSDPELRDRFVTDTAAQPDEFDEENAAMEAFVEEHGERFVLGSRETILDELLAHASADGGNSYVCLTGPPGSDTSALLAHFVRRATDSGRWTVSGAPQSRITDHASLLIPHFVGASPGSTDVRRTLRRLCDELNKGAGLAAEIPDDPEKLGAAFPDFLRQACARQRVVIVLDAVNQFDLASHSAGMHWLPEELPPNARVILSALGGPALEELRRRPRKPREIELKPLTADDGEAIIEQFRKRYGKKFDADQRAALLAKTDAGMPLYLLAALEELRTLGAYEEISYRIASLPPTTHELFAWILERLENDDGFRDASGRRVGRELVSRFAALLGASRYGLSQRELADLIDAGDPQGNVAALLHLLRPYLMRRGELLNFYHGQFREAAAEAWLKTDAERQAAHMQLADYFRHQADPNGDESWQGEQPRAFAELSYHGSNASSLDTWPQNLICFAYLEAVVRKVEVSAGVTPDGRAFAWHHGYYVVRDELEWWQKLREQITSEGELMQPLLQVWNDHEKEFVMSPDSIMQTLYRDLKAMDTREIFDRATRKIVVKQEGSLSTLCERERRKHENPAYPWVVVTPPNPSTSDAEYIFISYKREDLPRIVSFMHRIVGWGYPIWYDRGIPGGAEWDALIEEKVSHCKVLLVFLSEAAVESKWVRREIKFADSENRPILGIRLDKDVELKHGLKVVMNQYQMIDASNVDFSDQLWKAIEYVRLL